MIVTNQQEKATVRTTCNLHMSSHTRKWGTGKTFLILAILLTQQKHFATL